MWIWIVALGIVLVALFLGFGLRRTRIPRRVNIEGIEDEQVVVAYDRISRWPQFRLLRQIIVREIRKHRPAGTLADIGCGPGYLVARLARAFPSLTIIGVDIALDMLQAAEANMAAHKVDGRVSFRQGDIAKLPFEDNYLDFAVSTLSLHHWSEPRKAAEEMHRVLKPGGWMFIFDLRRDAPRMFHWLIRFATRVVVPAPLRKIREPEGSIMASYTVREVKDMLTATSFVESQAAEGFGWLIVWARKG